MAVENESECPDRVHICLSYPGANVGVGVRVGKGVIVGMGVGVMRGVRGIELATMLIAMLNATIRLNTHRNLRVHLL
jgi:tetrahydrodipicolinate N-succinyltransferase